MAEHHARGFCRTTPGALSFWFAAFLIFYGLSLLALVFWPQGEDFQASLLFASLGLACLANAAWNRTYHCFLMGPLFLGAAAILILRETGTLDVSSSLVWAMLLIGVGVAVLLEQRVAGSTGALDSRRGSNDF